MKLYLYEVLDFDDNIYKELIVANDPKQALQKVRDEYVDEEGLIQYKIDRISVTEVVNVGGYSVRLEKI